MIRPSRTTSPRGHDPRPALVPAGRFDAQPPFYLDRPVTLIGSRHRAHIRLESEDVSRSHAVVVNTRGRVIIRDLGSRTRVYVNGREAWEAALADGDYVSIGHFSFRFAAGDLGRYLGRAQEPPAAVLTGPVLPAGAANLDKDVCVIGCRQGADLLLRGSAVSFAHAVVVRHESGHLVRDLGSRTGTFLNGVPIEGDAELRHGSVLRVGPYELRYAAADPAPRAAARGAVRRVPRIEPADETPAARDDGLLDDALQDLPVLTPAAEDVEAPPAPLADAHVAPVELPSSVEELASVEPVPAAEVLPPAAAPEQAPAFETEEVPVTEAIPLAAAAPPAEPQPVADAPVPEVPKRRPLRKKKATKSKAKPRPEAKEAAAEDFEPLAPLVPSGMVTPLDAVTVVLAPAPPEPAGLTNMTVFLPPLEPWAEPAAPAAAPAGQRAAEPPAPQVAAPVVHEELPALNADLPPEPAPVAEPFIEEPAFADVAPPEIPSGDSEAAVLETFDFEAPARAPSDEASILPEIPMDVGLEPGPAQAFRAPEPDVASAPDFEAAADRWADHGRLPSPGTGEGRGEGSFLDGLNDSGIEGLEGRHAYAPAQSLNPPIHQSLNSKDPYPDPLPEYRKREQDAPPRLSGPPEAPRPSPWGSARHEPAKPPPTWGALASAIAMSELPLDEAGPPAPPPEAQAPGNPVRRSSRLKWFTALAVLLVGGAATVVAVFGHSALLKFLR